MSEVYARLRSDIITAVKSRERDRALALRTLDGSIQKVAIDTNKPIDDGLVLAVVRKAVKDLEGAKEAFAKGNRQDLVDRNDAEIAWISVYLPAAMGEAQIQELVDRAIAETGAQSRKEMGKVMGALKKHPESDRIDFAVANRMIQAQLPS